MAKIIGTQEVTALSLGLRKKGAAIVLAGGCFDILHPGHIGFLEKAKNAGDVLVVFLESDQKVTQLKGAGKPTYSQAERARELSKLPSVDYIVMLPYFNSDSQYDEPVKGLGPDIIASSSKDENIHHRRAARESGAKFKVVTAKIGAYSSSGVKTP